MDFRPNERCYFRGEGDKSDVKKKGQAQGEKEIAKTR
jgi:hypothetical protein